ncbi:MAG: hypothetical protein BMS9Abin26_1015 [Gammaproteobacteria bacterium]|nr:MAG: hypothetical protein BMS9Abin26_1015 [Gammaproteobacteria bacterium]
MPTILVIEASATIRHAQKKLLEKADFEVIIATSFRDGLEQLHSIERTFDGVIVGWPSKTDQDADELFSDFELPEYRNIPIVILAHQAEPAILGWVGRRTDTNFLLWKDYTESAKTIQKVIGESTRAGQSTPKPKKQEQPIRILFVDDSPTVRVKFRRFLVANGFQIETAASVNEAMEKAQDSQFDMAIIDYFMPDATGDVLCRKLKANKKTAGITSAIITGSYLDNAIKDSLEAGAVECMFKNESDELFLARIQAMSRSIRSQKAVDNERKRLIGILSSVGDGVYGVDNDGLITFINPAGKRILGFEPSELLSGRSPHKLFHYADKFGDPISPESCYLNKIYGNGEPLHGWETVFWHKAGKLIPVECTIYPLHIEGLLQGSVIAFRDISERKLLEDELRWQASHDPLTKLFNRRHFETQLGNEVHRLKRSDEISALLFIDLDRFKYINDSAGHAAGDKLLIEIASKFLSRLRKADSLARLGGDEFAIILRNIKEKDMFSAAEKFRQMLDTYMFSHSGKQYKINGSIGIANIDKDSISAGEVLCNADAACHIAKRSGRNKTHLFEPANDLKKVRDIELGWSAKLHSAPDDDRFILHYQPIVALNGIPYEEISIIEDLSGRGLQLKSDFYEILLRYDDPELGLIYPDAFLPTAERFNMIRDIDHWVIETTIKLLSNIQHHTKDATFAINLSRQSIDDIRLFKYVSELINKYEVNPENLIFEITETSTISNLDSARDFIIKFHELGCRFALDDFGSGFSSFSHLKHLPVDFIKIDGLFVQGVATDQIDGAIVMSINEMAHSLGKKTIAEYVENQNILEYMYKCGVDYVQGNFIGKANIYDDHQVQMTGQRELQAPAALY